MGSVRGFLLPAAFPTAALHDQRLNSSCNPITMLISKYTQTPLLHGQYSFSLRCKNGQACSQGVFQR